LCWRLPNVSVKYVLSKWSDVDPWSHDRSSMVGRVLFIYRGMYYGHALRGRDTFGPGVELYGMDQAKAIYRADVWLRAVDIGVVPENIRFMPKDGVDGREDVWQAVVHKLRSMNSVKGLSEEMVFGEVEEWIETGT
jgi:hypothetical protein